MIKNTHVGAAITADGFSAVQPIQTFEKDSFPKRNITNKLRNAHNNQKANKIASRGGSINESNQIVILTM